jgi:hypothetical protein
MLKFYSRSYAIEDFKYFSVIFSLWNVLSYDDTTASGRVRKHLQRAHNIPVSTGKVQESRWERLLSNLRTNFVGSFSSIEAFLMNEPKGIKTPVTFVAKLRLTPAIRKRNISTPLVAYEKHQPQKKYFLRFTAHFFHCLTSVDSRYELQILVPFS